MLIGLLAALTPLLARNVVVGAPVLSLSNRAAETFIMGNAADASPVMPEHPPSLAEILRRSDGHPIQVVRETLATYGGRVMDLLAHEALKARGLADPTEVPNNEAFS